MKHGNHETRGEHQSFSIVTGRI